MDEQSQDEGDAAQYGLEQQLDEGAEQPEEEVEYILQGQDPMQDDQPIYGQQPEDDQEEPEGQLEEDLEEEIAQDQDQGDQVEEDSDFDEQ